MTFVVAGGPVRQRRWIIERHCAAVLMNKPDTMFYLEGDSTDGTREYLEAHTNVFRHNTRVRNYTRDGSEGEGRYSSAVMADLRNRWAAEALRRWPSVTHLLVVDSDVIPEPDVLEKLLALKAPVAAAFVPIGDGETPIAMIGWDHESGQGRRTGEERMLTKPHAASVVGGCYLVEKSLVKLAKNHLWGAHAQGEDGWFAQFVNATRAPMLHHPGARCRHEMTKP